MCEFNNGCRFEGIGLVEIILGVSCGGYRGSIIDCSFCKEGEVVIGQMKLGVEGWKDECS